MEYEWTNIVGTENCWQKIFITGESWERYKRIIEDVNKFFFFLVKKVNDCLVTV